MLKAFLSVLGIAAGTYALSIAVPIICFVTKGCNLWGKLW